MAGFWPRLVLAQKRIADFSPGLGLVYGEGKTEHGGESVRAGLTSRRLQDDDRIGSMALMVEQHKGGTKFSVLDPTIEEQDVTLLYQSVYLEMKRFLPFANNIHYYWGVRGGYSRILGEVTVEGQQQNFKAEQLAPAALIALPMAFEHPGFLLLAFMDGTSAGLTVDIIPERIWLEYQISALLVPRYRDSRIVLEDLTVVTQVLQLAIVF